MEKKKKSLVSLVREFLPVLAVGTAIIAGSVGFAKWIYNQGQIYDGGLNVNGIVHAHAKQQHRTDYGFNFLAYDGNIVTLTFLDGMEAHIRDYNGNFRLDDADTVEGVTPNIASQVLAEIRDRAGDLTYISFY